MYHCVIAFLKWAFSTLLGMGIIKNTHTWVFGAPDGTKGCSFADMHPANGTSRTGKYWYPT